MVLHYKFEYLSNNNNIIKIIDSLTKEYDIEYKIQKTNSFINLFVKSSLEKLEDFSNYLSANVPMSIFFKNIDISSLEELPQDGINISSKIKSLSFCTKCLNDVENKQSNNYYNAFTSCNNCGQDIKNPIFVLKQDDHIIKKDNNIEYFEYVAKLLNDGNKIEIKTLSGNFVFAKLESIEDKYQDSLRVLSVRLENISKVFVASKQETVALASLEKPSISLRVNEIFKSKNIFKNEYINVRYCNDLILYLLSKELEKYKIDFLYYLETSKSDFTFSFESENEIENIDILDIKIIDNTTHILKSNSYNKSLDEMYLKFNDNAKGHFMTLLEENELYERSILSFYLSSRNSDSICLYSKEIDGLLDILTLKIDSKIENIFTKISQDERGSKLVNNYKNKFSKDYEKAINFKNNHKYFTSFNDLFKMLKITLNFENDIFQNASKALLEKGPRIDYKVKDSDKIFYKEFKVEKLLQSCLSFKLAGVDEKTISLGIVESLAHFVSLQIDLINEEVKLDGIALSGDMFLNDVFANFISKSITKNYKIYYNRDFPIDK